MTLTLSRPGVVNDDSGTWAKDNELFLKIFSGEVLTSFRRNCIFKDFVQKRSVQNSKSAQFPVTGRFTAGYHTPGTQLLGDGNMAQNEVVIKIDDMLVAHATVADIDDLKNHYDIKSIYATELGEAMSRQVDRRLARVICQAARQGTSDLTADLPSGLTAAGDDPFRTGTRIDLANATPTPDDYVASLFAAKQALDEKDVSLQGRVAVCTPEVHTQLVQSSRAVNADFNTPGSNGGYASGQVARLAGFEIYSSNHLAQGSVTAPSGEHGQVWAGSDVVSTVDMSATKMLCFQRGCAGMLSLKGLQMNMTGNDFNTQYLATLLTCRMAYGAGYLRPEAAVEVYSSV